MAWHGHSLFGVRWLGWDAATRSGRLPGSGSAIVVPRPPFPNCPIHHPYAGKAIRLGGKFLGRSALLAPADNLDTHLPKSFVSWRTSDFNESVRRLSEPGVAKFCFDFGRQRIEDCRCVCRCQRIRNPKPHKGWTNNVLVKECHQITDLLPRSALLHHLALFCQLHFRRLIRRCTPNPRRVTATSSIRRLGGSATQDHFWPASYRCWP